MNEYQTIEDLTLDPKQAQTFTEARTAVIDEVQASQDGVREASAEIEQIKARATQGVPVEPSELVNAEAALDLARERLRGAEARERANARKTAPVSDLDFLKAVAPTLEPIHDGLVPMLYGTGRAPRQIPEGYSEPLLVITQDKPAELEDEIRLIGEFTITYFHSSLHIPLTKELLERQIDRSLDLSVTDVRPFSDGSTASIKAAAVPEHPYIYSHASVGDTDGPAFIGAFFDTFGKRFGKTRGRSPYVEVWRCSSVREGHTHYSAIKPSTDVTDVFVDASGVQHVTATITQGWTVLSPLYQYEQIRTSEFPSIVDNGGPALIGGVDSTFGRITEVVEIDAQPLYSNVFGVTMTVKASGEIR